MTLPIRPRLCSRKSAKCSVHGTCDYPPHHAKPRLAKTQINRATHEPTRPRRQVVCPLQTQTTPHYSTPQHTTGTAQHSTVQHSTTQDVLHAFQRSHVCGDRCPQANANAAQTGGIRGPCESPHAAAVIITARFAGHDDVCAPVHGCSPHLFTRGRNERGAVAGRGVSSC